MAYEKQTWVTGEVITKEKLNHMEDGIADSGVGSGVFIANLNTETQSLDKTWNEIKVAFTNGQPAYVVSKVGEIDAMYPILECNDTATGYKVRVLVVDPAVDAISFSTDDPNGYPSFGSNIDG